MSFLFPLYFLGIAAIAVPILLHLRRRPPKDHIPFSSLMFLEKTPERLTRRTKLERWLLLALRCLAIMLLAFAFCRPFFSSFQLPSERDSIARTVIVVDQSASMQRDGLWDKVKKAALDAVESVETPSEIALLSFDGSSEVRSSFVATRDLSVSARKKMIESELGESPSWRKTNLGDALTKAAELLISADANGTASRKEIILISDFQEGSDRNALNESAWPEDVFVEPVSVLPDSNGNLSLTLAASPPRSNVDEEEVYRVRISNSIDSDSADVSLLWSGFPQTTLSTLIAPGTSRIVSTPPRPQEALEGILEITGDATSFDNRVYVSPVQARPLRVAFIREQGVEEGAGSPLFYLRRALQATPALEPVITAFSTTEGVELTEFDAAIVVDAFSASTATALQTFAKSGGLVIATPSSETESISIATLADAPDWELSEAPVSDYALLSDIDFDHPVLKPFAIAKIRDFTKVRFWKHRSLTFDSNEPTVLARFDKTAPAIVEHSLGEGALYVFLSGWNPKDSQLALSSKFVPLLFSLFEHAGYSSRSAPTLYIDETRHDVPGFYEEQVDETTLATAVNLSPSEGNTTPFDPEVVFSEIGIPLTSGEPQIDPNLSSENRLRVESEQKEEKQKLWKWLILAALIFLLLETWLAGRRPGNSSTAPLTS